MYTWEQIEEMMDDLGAGIAITVWHATKIGDISEEVQLKLMERIREHFAIARDTLHNEN